MAKVSASHLTVLAHMKQQSGGVCKIFKSARRLNVNADGSIDANAAIVNNLQARGAIEDVGEAEWKLTTAGHLAAASAEWPEDMKAPTRQPKDKTKSTKRKKASRASK